jgi:hypothetical protein
MFIQLGKKIKLTAQLQIKYIKWASNWKRQINSIQSLTPITLDDHADYK